MQSSADSVTRPRSVFHFLLGVDAVAMAIQGDAIMHAAVAGGRHLEKPASSLIGYQRPRTTFRHESDDTAVDNAACFGRLIQAFIMCAFVATFKAVHGHGSIMNEPTPRGFPPQCRRIPVIGHTF
jgi:hypothetical protein